MKSMYFKPLVGAEKHNKLSEIYWVVSIIVVLLVVLFLFSSQAWTVWSDEVLLTDPAANLFLGNGFTSSAWYFQSKEEFWACNAPLHASLLYFWIKAFGLNVVSVRSFNYALIGIASLLIWLSVYRMKMISLPRNRLISIVLIVLSQGVSFNYLSGRYDCLAIALFSGLAFAYTLSPSWGRNVLLLGLSALISAAGFHLLPYAAGLLVLLYLFVGKAFLKPAIWMIMGLVLGLFAVMSIYLYQGVFSTFIETVGGHSLSHVEVPESAKVNVESKIMFVLQNVFPILIFRMQELSRWYCQDVSFSLLWIAALLSIVSLKFQGLLKVKSPLVFSFVFASIVPLAMGLFRNYPDYYTWMAIIPLCIGISSVLPVTVTGTTRKLAAVLIFSLLVASCVVGLPKRLIPAAQNFQASRYGIVENFVESNIRSDDRVFSDFGPYYAVKNKVDFVLFPTYLDVISQAEKDQLTVLLLDAKQVNHNYETIDLLERLDGDWSETGQMLETPQYSLKILRRLSADVAMED